MRLAPIKVTWRRCPGIASYFLFFLIDGKRAGIVWIVFVFLTIDQTFYQCISQIKRRVLIVNNIDIHVIIKFH